MATVRLEGVTKRYENGHVAVRDVSFEVTDGEFVVLVGPSGCGKSTTLRMVAGLERITEGQLWIGGRRVNEVPPKDRDLAMVFQNYALYPHMTVYDNMAFGLKLRKYPKEEIETRVRGAADVLGIAGILDRKPKQLSGGQRQRVAVGRAIVRKPQVFLFDEPLSNLDAQLRVQMRAEIAKLHRRLEATMIYVTHDQVEAMTMGDRIVVLNDGRIQQVDTPMRLYTRPVNRFVAGFIGSPAMNFIEGRVVQEGEGLCFQSRDEAFSLPLREREEVAERLKGGGPEAITLGIRPEDIYVAGRALEVEATEPVRLQVEVLEPMGNETFLYVRRGEGTLIARVAPQPLPGPGGPVDLVFDVRRLHFFDASGAALGRAEGVVA